MVPPERESMGLQELLVVLAGFVGGFFSTLASNGSSVTLPRSASSACRSTWPTARTG
jgi:hypothetical protein